MDVGLAIIFQGTDHARSDLEVYQQELRLGWMAESLGFQSIWGVEHHFTDYTMCPDVLQMLTYFAAKSDTLLLGSMVVVLPWHNPMRVAEEVSDARQHVERPRHPRPRARPRPGRVRGLRRRHEHQPRHLRRGGADDPRRPRAAATASTTAST